MLIKSSWKQLEAINTPKLVSETVKRKDAITAAAITRVESIISECVGNVKSTSSAIDRICRAYVMQRAEVLKPTALAVAGELGMPVQTIYNNVAYNGIVRIWVQAYIDLNDVGAGSLKSREDQIKSADLSSMDMGTRHTFQLLQQINEELKRENRMLRKLREQETPLQTEETNSDLLISLDEWACDARDFGFALDDKALRVTSNTPPGTIVMPRRLFDALSGHKKRSVRST